MTSPILDHLLQSTVFAVAAALLARFLRRNRAATRFCIWLAASIKFLVPFSFLVGLGQSVDLPQAARAAAPLASTMTQLTISSPPIFSSPGPHPLPTAAILLSVWLIGAFVILLRWAIQWNVVRRSVAAATTLNISAPIPVRSTPHLMEPGVFGIVRPVLLLPAGITDRLSPDQLAAILAHELCHVRRHDNLTAAIHMFIQAAFWFHPLVWWIGARLVEERERACDEEVLRLGNQPAAYAEGILNVCKFCLESPMPCVAGVTGADLKKRIEAIMTQRLSNQLTASRKLLLAAAGFIAVAIPVTIGILHPSSGRAQVTKPLEFEVASIKSAAADAQGSSILIQPGGVFRATNAPLKLIIALAYDVRIFEINGGPSWMNSDRFDITAKPPAGESPEDDPRKMADEQRTEFEKRFKERIRSLLADRFHLVVRKDTKEVPGYALVVAKGGSKLKPSEGEGTGNRGIRMQRGVMNGMQAPVEFLTKSLADVVGKPVIDKTGLAGKYDWKLEWTPDQEQLKPGQTHDNAETAPPDLSGPSIFTALQEQLGLKLEATKAPAPVVVIERVEKPSAN
ncbi:MAG: M56 and DUF3738 domain-containing protein [Acidobacteriota bacterium]|nr:M56 and DUF3738 domain-containing protein [Acidobacteriota bacterium]